MIYTIRGKKVMLDSDVAKLYHYETKNVNKAMKRNLDRFPEEFCFPITERGLKDMWFQFGTTYNKIKFRSEKYLPYVYTEQGIAMLAGVLKSELSKIGFKKETRNKRMSNSRVQQIVTLLYLNKKVTTSKGVLEHQSKLLQELKQRIEYHIDYYSKNTLIQANFSFLNKIVDIGIIIS